MDLEVAVVPTAAVATVVPAVMVVEEAVDTALLIRRVEGESTYVQLLDPMLMNETDTEEATAAEDVDTTPTERVFFDGVNPYPARSLFTMVSGLHMICSSRMFKKMKSWRTQGKQESKNVPIYLEARNKLRNGQQEATKDKMSPSPRDCSKSHPIVVKIRT